MNICPSRQTPGVYCTVLRRATFSLCDIYVRNSTVAYKSVVTWLNDGHSLDTPSHCGNTAGPLHINSLVDGF